MPDPRPATTEEIIQGYAKMFGVPPDLALAVAKKESNFNTGAIGDGGEAIGTFQLHQGAATDTGVDRTDPTQNIIGGIKYLGQLSKRYKGDVQKVLQAYNGGMEGVDAGTPSAAAQAYAFDVLGNLSQGLRTQAAAGKPTFTDQSVPVTGPAQPPSPPPFAESLQVLPGITMGNVKGFAKGAGETVTRLGEMVRKRFPSLAVGPEVTFSTEATTPEQQAGKSAERIAEFMGASELAGGATATAPLLTKAAAQAATGYGVSKAQGASETGSRLNAALGALGPVVSEAMPAIGQIIRNRALTQLALKLSRGLAEPNPAVEYGLKTGDVSPDVASAVGIVRQAASDILDAPLRATWGKWMATLGKDAAQKGKTLGKALEGDLGNEMFFKQPIYDELDKLKQTSAQHFAEVKGGSTNVTYNPELLKAVDDLKGTLDQYGDMISARNLSDLKRTWDDIVYTLSTSGKVGLGSEVLLNSAKKKAVSVGANAIRHIFDEKSPTIAALNEAASHAYRLQDLVQKVYTKQPGVGAGAKVALGTLGSVGGFLGGQTVGHPYVVMGMGAAASRAIVKAMESPLFQTLAPATKTKIAEAIASGNSQAVVKLLTPVLQAETAASTTVH